MMQQLLSSVNQMTRGRERPLLEAALVEAVLTLVTAASVRIYKLEETAGKTLVWTSVEIDTTGTQLHDDGVSVSDDLHPVDEFPLVTACLASGLTQNKGDATVFPMLTKAKHWYGFIEIVGKPLDAGQIDLVAELLVVFANLLALLDYSEIDTLTGLLNRKTFDEYLWRILSSLFKGDENRKRLVDQPRRRRTHTIDQGHWLGVIDIDHFKSVNDTYGHSIGDEVLLLIANMMKTSFRTQDKLFRFGGEEFVVLLKPTKEKEAHIAFDRFRKTVETRDFPLVGRITVSIGFARIKPTDQPSAIFDRADQALYWVKKHGRNQSCNYEILLATGKLAEKDEKINAEFF